MDRVSSTGRCEKIESQMLMDAWNHHDAIVLATRSMPSVVQRSMLGCLSVQIAILRGQRDKTQ